MKDIVAIPTSLATEAAAIELGIPLTTFADHPRIDLTIDGADEVDPDFNVIKGGGGALLREKIVAQASARLVIVVDESKLSARLGTLFYVPVEVIPFGWETQAAFLRGLGAAARLRVDGDAPYQTDQGNLILDCEFGPIADVEGLARAIAARDRRGRARALHRNGERGGGCGRGRPAEHCVEAFATRDTERLQVRGDSCEFSR